MLNIKTMNIAFTFKMYRGASDKLPYQLRAGPSSQNMLIIAEHLSHHIEKVYHPVICNPI